MSPSPRGGRRRRFFLPIVAALFALAAAGIVVTSLIPGLVLRGEQEREIAEVRRRLAETRAENLALREEVARLSDPSYLEMVARSRYNLARPGERLFNVIDVPERGAEPTGSAGAAGSEDPAAPADRPWWHRLSGWRPGF